MKNLKSWSFKRKHTVKVTNLELSDTSETRALTSITRAKSGVLRVLSFPNGLMINSLIDNDHICNYVILK